MRPLLAALCLAAGTIAVPAAERLWEPMASLPAGGNAGLACGVVDGRIVVAGGTDLSTGVKQALDYVLAFDESGNRWRQIGRLPRPYYYGAFASDGHALFVIGGADIVRTRTDCWAVDGAGSSRKFSELPKPLGYVGCTTWRNACYILGGARNVRDVSVLTAEFIRIDLGTGAVSRLADYPDGPVFQSSLAPLGSRIYAFPGGGYDQAGRIPVARREAWSYNLDAARWDRIAAYPFPVRATSAAVLDGTHIFIGGGTVVPATPGGLGASSRAFVYDVRTDRYCPLPNLPFAAMLIGLQRHGDWLYIIGGEDLPRHRNSGVYRARVRDLLAVLERNA